MKVGLFDPTGMPATNHWYAGALPPFTGVAVNVTEVPEHMGLTGFARIDTDGTKILFTVKVAALISVPTEIGPVVAVAGKMAVIWVALSTLKEVAVTPLKVTEVAPVKPVPVMTTAAAEPAQALVGVKLAIDWAKLSIPIKKAIKTNR